MGICNRFKLGLLLMLTSLSWAFCSAAAAQVPATPTGLTAAPGNAEIALRWSATSGATSYHLKRSTASGGPYTAVSYTHLDVYKRQVLLLLASERPPHNNFLPGWQAVVPDSLHTHYVNAHHRDLLKGENARGVANAIASHLVPEGGDKSSVRGAGTPDPLAAVQTGNLATI